MSFVTFVMGQKEAYFFNSPTHWARHNLPPEVEALFTKQPPIKDVLELAVGDNGTYFVSYRDADGGIYCRHYNLPNPLTNFLYHGHPHVIRDVSTLSLTLGPYESYYAHDKTSASWSNLPPTLEKAIEHRLESQDPWRTIWTNGGNEEPIFVSLGAHGAYFMRTRGGGGGWDVGKGKSEGLEGINKFLDDSPNFLGIAGLFLFASHPTSYVLLQTNGKAFSNLPEHTWADYQKLAPALERTFATSHLPPQPIRPQSFQAPSPVPSQHSGTMPPPQAPQQAYQPQMTGSGQGSVPQPPTQIPQSPAPPYREFASPVPQHASPVQPQATGVIDYGQQMPQQHTQQWE